MSEIRALIVDDHPVTREGLRTALELSDDVAVVGEASSGEEAVDRAGELTPDVVFMDVRMPGMDGIVLQVRPDPGTEPATVAALAAEVVGRVGRLGG